MTWRLPPANIFSRSPLRAVEGDEYLAKLGDLLTEKLDSLGCRCEVENIVQAPQLVRFEMVPSENVKVRNLPRLAPELAYEMAVEKVRILAPIPGKRAIGIEIPHPLRSTVRLGDIIEHAHAPLTFPLGLDVQGNAVTCNLAEMPHLLVGGQTGAGKSVFINSMLCSLLATCTPDELGLVLIDPKRVELTLYQNMPHLLRPVVDDPYIADDVFLAAVDVMEDRYATLAAEGHRDIAEHNAKGREPWVHIVMVVDELADLMMVNRGDVEPAIARLAQKGRAAGVHLVLATQSPRVQVCTGIVKANIPARVALACSSMVDSRVILDMNGAESLLGNGDMLYLPTGASTPARVQGALVELDEINTLVEHWAKQNLAVAA